jgi:hypothetical protein
MQKTVIGTFKKVLEGVSKSRQQFEEAPDLGLLGKNVSRIFNYFECYVFRFLFVGIFLVLVCYPVLILAGSAISAALILTFWAWMPILLLATYLFNVFIKQFETAYIRYGFFSRFLPFFEVIAMFVACFVILLLAVLNLLVFAPFRTIFVFGYGVLAQLFRRTIDKVMMFIFTHLGRTPSRNSLIAKKISGPGMSK